MAKSANGSFAPLNRPGLGVEIDEALVIERSRDAPDWRNPLWRHADAHREILT
jgi:galactonate dehydratase